MPDDDAPETDLSLVGTLDLVEELFRRHAAMVIVREVESPDGTMGQTVHDFRGGISRAIGMATRLQHYLLYQCHASNEESPGG